MIFDVEIPLSLVALALFVLPLLALALAARRLGQLHARPQRTAMLSSPYRTPTLTPPEAPRRAPRWPRAVAAVAAALVLASPLLAVVQCAARLPPVSGCAPLATSCIGDAPQVCSASQRWEPASDTTCGVLGGVCVEDSRGAHCARAPRDAAPDATVDAAEGGAP